MKKASLFGRRVGRIEAPLGQQRGNAIRHHFRGFQRIRIFARKCARAHFGASGAGINHRDADVEARLAPERVAVERDLQHRGARARSGSA